MSVLNMTGRPIPSQLIFVVMDSGPALRASRNDGGGRARAEGASRNDNEVTQEATPASCLEPEEVRSEIETVRHQQQRDQ